MNSLGESAENQVFRVRKPSVQKNKCFVCVYAGNKSSVNTPSAHGQCLLSSKWRLLGIRRLVFFSCPMLSQRKTAMHQRPSCFCFTSSCGICPVTKNKAYRQLITLKYATKINSQPVFVLTGRNRFISEENFWNPYKKIQKPPAMFI